MPDYDELIHSSAAAETARLKIESPQKKTFTDYFALAVTTFGVGYLPLAPGTWGSVVGVLIYLLASRIETLIESQYLAEGFSAPHISAWIQVINLSAFLVFCLLGIWAANRATVLFRDKDPSQAVVDEVIGQILTFLFVPFEISGWLIFAGFLLFRLFDIWKPYPIDSLQNLPAGIGVCADDVLAGVYAGLCLAFLYAITLSF